MVNFGNSWDELLKGEFDKPYYKELRTFLVHEYKNFTVFPPMEDIFNSLKYADYDKIKVVIIGQDPYHEPNQAHGLSFSVRKGVKIPPSLVNIYKEINDELGLPIPQSGELTAWAKQGVLLLNNVLTVRQGVANSHRGKGWETFTCRVIELLNQREKPLVFLLWGRNAQEKIPLITNKNHLVLTAAHPSPLSAFNGFFGCGHFAKTNEFLRNNGIEEIDWRID